MSIFKALNDTPVGRALIAFWHDLPFWFMLGALFALLLLPAGYLWAQGYRAVAIVVTWPAALVLSGMARAFAQTVAERPPRWDAFKGPHLWTGITVWLTLALGALSFTFQTPPPVFWLQCATAAALLLLAPLVLCGSVLLSTPPLLSWRNALVLAVHRPLFAVGLVAVAVLIAWAGLSFHILLALVIPGLWMSIATYTTSSVMHEIASNGG